MLRTLLFPGWGLTHSIPTRSFRGQCSEYHRQVTAEEPGGSVTCQRQLGGGQAGVGAEWLTAGRVCAHNPVPSCCVPQRPRPGLLTLPSLRRTQLCEEGPQLAAGLPQSHAHLEKEPEASVLQ